MLSVFRGVGEQQQPAVRVAVRNGTGAPGLASEVEFVLELAGFNVVEASNADRFTYEATTIRFDPSQRADALEVQSWLSGDAVLQERDEDTGLLVELIVGPDYEGLRQTSEGVPVRPNPDELAIGTRPRGREHDRSAGSVAHTNPNATCDRDDPRMLRSSAVGASGFAVEGTTVRPHG